MSLYEEINYEQLELLEKKHNWIVEPIYNASTYVKNIESPIDFKKEN